MLIMGPLQSWAFLILILAGVGALVWLLADFDAWFYRKAAEPDADLSLENREDESQITDHSHAA